MIFFNKLIVAIIILGLFPLSACAAVSAEAAQAPDGGIRVMINDRFLSLPQAPVVIEGRTLLPFRAIYEFLGADVFWNDKTRSVTAKRGQIQVELQVDNRMAIVNNEKVMIDVAARIQNNRLMVPIRFFAQTLGAQVDWDENEKIISISLETVSGITLDNREVVMDVGDLETLRADVFPAGAVNKNVNWLSTNPSVARITRAGGMEAAITGVNPGQTIIIATTEEGDFSATSRVTVRQLDTPVMGISLNIHSFSLVVGGSPAVLTAVVAPENARNKNIVWKSSVPAVATANRHTVDRGIITPLREGITVISATTEDGEYVATCVVTVVNETN